MAKIHGKKQTSKRKSLSLQHKIVAKSNEKKRKIRGEARKAAKGGIKIKRKKHSLTIPALWPFKQEELLQQKQRQVQKDLDREKHKELSRQKTKQLQKSKKKAATKAPSRPVYGLGQTIENCDLIIEIVDARDPLATRCLGLEQIPNKPNKIIVVTKGDLIPRAQLKQWLTYLRNKTGQPVVALTKRTNAEDAGKKTSQIASTQKKPLKPLGFKSLIKVMQAFNAARCIGIFGYPLVGKHTVENYLKSPQMNLSKKAKIACASIMEASELQEHADLLFTQKPQSSNLPLMTLKRLFERCESKKDLQLKLKLPDHADTRELLEKMMKERKLPGPNDAARTLLKLWNQHRYFTKTPSEENAPEQNVTELKCQSLTKDELATIYEEGEKELDAADVVSNWGRAELTLGMLWGAAPSSENKAAMETDAEKLSEENYFQIKLPVGADLKTVKVGGPEPFFLSNVGASGQLGAKVAVGDDEAMVAGEEDEEEEEEEEGSDDEDMK